MIVNTFAPYDSELLENNIISLFNQFPFLRKEIVGYSVCKNPIYSIVFGHGKKQIFYFGSIHANESIVSQLLMEFIEELCIAYKSNSSILGYSVENIFEKSTIYIVPMANPDGVDLVNNPSLLPHKYYVQAKSIAYNYPSIPFANGWKANINGVDLNLQFPAGWEQAKEIKYSQGFTRTCTS